jgi:hypothetical protein
MFNISKPRELGWMIICSSEILDWELTCGMIAFQTSWVIYVLDIASD